MASWIKFRATRFLLCPSPWLRCFWLACNIPVPLSTLGWILLAMVAARSASMGFNRYADVRFDLLNPRTANRPLTAGTIGKPAVLVLITVSSLVFLLAAGMLGRLCLFLALPVLVILFVYSYTKRFTAFSHLYLGFAIGLAPVGAWIAASGGLDLRILLLALALFFYIGGFDILYACQDIDFDRSVGFFRFLPGGVRCAPCGRRRPARVDLWLSVGGLFGIPSGFGLSGNLDCHRWTPWCWSTSWSSRTT